MSAQVRRRPQESERFLRLLTVMRTQIEYALLPTQVLLDKLCADSEFADFSFIHAVRGAFGSGMSFQNAWNKALRAYAASSALGTQELELLSAFAGTFGSTDKDGQTANCSYFIEQLEQIVKAQREFSAKTARLYNALGILSGLFLVILLL